jgi:hypothetical protein
LSDVAIIFGCGELEGVVYGAIVPKRVSRICVELFVDGHFAGLLLYSSLRMVTRK